MEHMKSHHWEHFRLAPCNSPASRSNLDKYLKIFENIFQSLFYCSVYLTPTCYSISFSLINLMIFSSSPIWTCRFIHNYNDQYQRGDNLFALISYLSICLANLSNLSVFPNTGVPHSSYQCLQYIIFIILYATISISCQFVCL